MFQRLVRLFGLALLPLVWAVSCESGGGGLEAPRIGLVTINQQALFFNQMIEGAQQEALVAGSQLSVFNANNDPAAQNNAIENLTIQGFDAVIVVAIDVEGIKPALRLARDANLKVVAVDAIVTDPSVQVQVGSDNRAGGEVLGHFVDQWAKAGAAAPARIGIVGALNSFIQIERQQGFETSIGQGGHDILQVVDSRNIQEVALSACESLITARPNLMAVYATGEAALIGTIAAVRAQAATGRIAVFGWDLTAAAIRAIDDGFLKAVVQQDARTQGREALRAALTLVKGGEVSSQIQVPIQLVTKENLDEYRQLYQ